MRPLRILFVAAEMAPLVKVGGLGDVAGALPSALAERGHDVRVLMPAYSERMVGNAREHLRLPGDAGRLLEYDRDSVPVPLWLLETPGFLRRGGQPYLNRAGRPWADNALQFGRLGRAAALLAAGADPDWIPDIVHCNDWHTGLAPVYMHLDGTRTASMLTIHNLAYTGCFDPDIMPRLKLPVRLYRTDALEFHGDISFLKGGLVHATRLTTVSPGYAREILTPEQGAGMDGILRDRSEHLTGILNGLDYRHWDPANDGHLRHRFDARDLAGKRKERMLVERDLGLESDDARSTPLLVWIGRLAHQKGADLLLEALPRLMQQNVRLAILGSGDRDHERALMRAARKWPDRISVTTDFNETLAHRLYAAGDMLLMPSRFEPCGLAQLCAMRYGNIPIVTRVGGLADTVTDVGEARIDKATGFFMRETTAEALVAAVTRATGVFREGRIWPRLMANAMRCRYDWSHSAESYERVYRSALPAERVNGQRPVVSERQRAGGTA